MGNLRTQIKEYVNTPIIPHIYTVSYGLKKKVLSCYYHSTDRKLEFREANWLA